MSEALPAEIQQLQDAEGFTFVVTPGGPRTSDRVVQVAADEIVRVPRRRAKPSEDHPYGVQLGGPARAQWIVAAICQGGSVQEFTADIVVPAEPTRRNGQLLYVFTGLQDEPTTMILQPVLQWGAPGDPQGWRICSWLVDRQTNRAHATPTVGVAPGARIKAYLRLVGRNGAKLQFACGFDGFPSTTMTIETERALRTAVAVLEAYRIQGSSDFPPDPAIRFEQVRLTQKPSSSWSPRNLVIDGGQHAEIVRPAEPCVFELHCR
jgi:hypothetical protein